MLGDDIKKHLYFIILHRPPIELIVLAIPPWRRFEISIFLLERWRNYNVHCGHRLPRIYVYSKYAKSSGMLSASIKKLQ